MVTQKYAIKSQTLYQSVFTVKTVKIQLVAKSLNLPTGHKFQSYGHTTPHKIIG